MDRIRERLVSSKRALQTLQELVNLHTVSHVERDAAIQRFEYTFESIWKTAQLFLKEIEGLEIGSPKGVIRASFQTHLLTEDETRLALAMADDRNLTSHTYNKGLADKIYKELGTYADLLEKWLQKIEKNM